MGIFGNHLIWVILLVIVLIIFGPGKLPQIGSAVGSALKEFRKATTELRDEVARTSAPAEGGQSEPNKEATGAPKA